MYNGFVDFTPLGLILFDTFYFSKIQDTGIQDTGVGRPDLPNRVPRKIQRENTPWCTLLRFFTIMCLVLNFQLILYKKVKYF